MYILFEGIDRVGKSTQIELLQRYFKDIVITKEPGGTPLGEEIRQMVLHNNSMSDYAQMFLFLADRAEHIQKIIKPNLNKLIISDRGFLSGIAYAHIKSRIDIATLKRLNDIATQKVYPDKIIFFEITQAELLKRMDKAPLDSIEERGIHYLLQVQDIMKSLLPTLHIPYVVIDATQKKEKIFDNILHIIKDGND